MISTGIPIENGAIEQAKRLPTDKEMKIISPKEAKTLFGPDAELIDGVSVSLGTFASCTMADNLSSPVARQRSQTIVRLNYSELILYLPLPT